MVAGVGFLASFCFFLFAYPYHLMRREQLNLFLYDWDYIGRTYRGVGWLARLCCDFLEQFFHLPAGDPALRFVFRADNCYFCMIRSVVSMPYGQS